MYLYLGQSVVTPFKDIIGVFDFDNSSWAYKTREFLEQCEREGRVVNAASDIPRSFVVCRKGKNDPVVYLSQLSAGTLRTRLENEGFE